MGVPGLLVPEEAGGLGLDEVAAAVVWEQTGYAAVPFGVVEIAGVVAPLLAQAEEVRAGLLASVLTGEERPVVQAPEASSVPWFDAAATRHVVALAVEAATIGDVDRAVATRSVDGARRLAEVVAVEPVALVGGEVALAVRRATLGTAAQLVGLTQRMLDMTVAYVIERRQYGVAIGSFQAVKHHLADVRLQLEFARPAVLGAAWALATRQPTAARDTSMAKALASDCAQLAARKALQCHGAIGHTVEYDLHLFVKRAWALARAWGDAAQHRDAVARAIGLTGSPVT
jgi:alkylation response protein AidB-like acyl-CoA dehydrogenase